MKTATKEAHGALRGQQDIKLESTKSVGDKDASDRAPVLTNSLFNREHKALI